MPDADAVGPGVGVAEVTVEEVEQRADLLDAGDDVGGGGRGVGLEVPARGVGRVRSGLPRHTRRTLVAEAGEGERSSAGRRRVEGAGVGGGAVVLGRVQVVGVGLELADQRVMDPDGPPGGAVHVGLRRRVRCGAEAATQRAVDDPRVLDGRVGDPRDDHLAAWVGAEGQVQALDRGGGRAGGETGDLRLRRNRLGGSGAEEQWPGGGAGHCRAEQAERVATRDSSLLGFFGHSGGPFASSGAVEHRPDSSGSNLTADCGRPVVRTLTDARKNGRPARRDGHERQMAVTATDGNSRRPGPAGVRQRGRHPPITFTGRSGRHRRGSAARACADERRGDRQGSPARRGGHRALA